MKRKNIQNNIEDKININGSTWSSTPTMNFEKESVGVDDHIDPFNEKGITLIALIITIILMLILAGVVISLTIGENGLFRTAKYAVVKTEEETAREKLELAIANLQTKKYVDVDYDEDKYIDNYLTKENMAIEGNIVLVDGWRFEIDRSIPKAGESLGKGELKTVTITTPYVGTTSFTTKIFYVYNEEEIESYIYKIDNEEITNLDKEYTTTEEQELQPESTHTVKVIAKYKDGTTLESNVVTIKTEPRTYLYNNGDECIDITGGWKAIAIGSGSSKAIVVKEPTLAFDNNLKCMNAQIYADSDWGHAGSIIFNNKIDYSKYKTINIVYTASLTKYNDASSVTVLKNYDNVVFDENHIGYLCYTNKVSTKEKFSQEIAKINNFDNFYIYLQAYKGHTVSINIYEVWLEK